MSYFRTGDPLEDFDRYDMAQAQYEAKLPQCEKCGKPIQDEIYFFVNNEIRCEDCMIDEYGRSTQDFLSDNY